MQESQSDNMNSACLSILNNIFIALVVGPCVVGYVRGTWNLVVFYVYPMEMGKLTGSWQKVAFGLAGATFFCLLQGPLRNTFHPAKGRVLFYVVSRSYIYVHGFTGVCWWQGVWGVLDLPVGGHYSALAMLIASTLVLWMLRALRNLSVAPFSAVNDTSEYFFDWPTFFNNWSSSSSVAYFILDCLFSVMVIGSLIALAWRSCWFVMDWLIFPNAAILSCWTSLGMAYGIFLVSWALRPAMAWVYSQPQGIAKMLVVGAYHIFTFLGSVNSWRGIWLTIDMYFFPDNALLSYWLTHSSCMLLLIATNCGTAVVVRGILRDAEEPLTVPIVLPWYCLSRSSEETL